MLLLSLPNFVARLESKDWLTLGMSFSALLLTAASYIQKLTENRQSLRKQLTDVLEKLTELKTEVARFNSLSDKDGYPREYDGLLNDQRRFFVRQAGYLAEQIPRLVSPYECLVIAGAFADIEYIDVAEYWFQKACAEQPSARDRAIAIRGYGRFLFIQGRLDEARVRFQQAVKLMAGDSDIAVAFRANTLERQAELEQEWGLSAEAKSLLETALQEYSGLSNPGRRQRNSVRVQEKLNKSFLKTPVAQIGANV